MHAFEEGPFGGTLEFWLGTRSKANLFDPLVGLLLDMAPDLSFVLGPNEQL